MHPYTIYMVVSKDGRCYIGQTSVAIEKRWKDHVRHALDRRNNSHFANSIRKYGPEFFTLRRIDSAASPEEANELEMAYIRLFRSLDPDYGFNSTPGGDRIVHTPEMLQKMSAASLERWKDPEFRAAHTGHQYWLGKHHTEETKKKIGDAQRGIPRKKASLETLEKLSLSHMGKSAGSDHYAWVDVPLDVVKELYEEFQNMSEVARRLGTTRTVIKARCVQLGIDTSRKLQKSEAAAT